MSAHGRFYVGAGAIAPNLALAPQMWHKTLFDELKMAAYRFKKERSVAFKFDQNITQLAYNNK